METTFMENSSQFQWQNTDYQLIDINFTLNRITDISSRLSVSLTRRLMIEIYDLGLPFQTTCLLPICNPEFAVSISDCSSDNNPFLQSLFKSPKPISLIDNVFLSKLIFPESSSQLWSLKDTGVRQMSSNLLDCFIPCLIQHIKRHSELFRG